MYEHILLVEQKWPFFIYTTENKQSFSNIYKVKDIVMILSTHRFSERLHQHPGPGAMWLGSVCTEERQQLHCHRQLYF